jgi:spore coat polysaccharide biosynthesis protein SpsF
MRVGVFIQVRIASTRLKRKALLPLVNGTIIEHAMRALRRMDGDVFALLTDKSSAHDLEALALKEGFDVFVGPKQDVLARYAMAARYFDTDQVIRATGDNPLVSAKMGNLILDIHKSSCADLSHFLGLPLGTGIEVVRSGALCEAADGAEDPFEREHMTTYLYRHRDRFKVLEEPCPSAYHLPEVKVSIDERHEYELVLDIYRAIYRDCPIEIDELTRWLVLNLPKKIRLEERIECRNTKDTEREGV